ncbi:UDP-glucuronosyl/UDP-glucosyltransferase [Trema orientale]|uniref:Glycosyltransferase n=1 Tax=Trema orientale TaxID=63057 RepID=A0A2P5B7K7_TREOI|nr:UDP-glucuronosyl/UDP-glucosyltransferase [Trema orientale]
MQARLSNDKIISVLMLPWLAHGHISPYLELAKRLAHRNLHVYFCSTPANLVSVKPKFLSTHHQNSVYTTNIEFIEIHLPELPGLPSHLHTTNGLPPHLMPTLKQAFDMSASPNFLGLLEDLGPDLVIYDFIQPWAPLVASQKNIPAVEFLSISASMMSFCFHLVRNSMSDEKFPFPAIYLRGHEVGKFVKLLESSANGVKDKERVEQCSDRSVSVVLLRTSREIEDKYIEYVSVLHGNDKKIVPVGLLVDDDDHDHDHDDDDQVMKWLKRKEGAEPVVFVSFGSEYFLSRDEIREVAKGLELSGVGFIWVIRFAAGSDPKTEMEEALPEGYLKRIEDKGLVLEGWAPQRAILKSQGVKGFVSHCGWSSVLESMRYGVPIIAMPMNLDQPINARLVEEIGVGVEVRRDGIGGRIRGEELGEVIRKVVVEESGERVREKAVEMREEMRRNGDEEMDLVVKELVKLCRKENLQSN